MERIIKVKDWLIQKNTKKQFKVLISHNKQIMAVETSNGLKFCLGTSKVDKNFYIATFHEDGIHVSVDYFQSRLCMEINTIQPTYAFNYNELQNKYEST